MQDGSPGYRVAIAYADRRQIEKQEKDKVDKKKKAAAGKKGKRAQKTSDDNSCCCFCAWCMCSCLRNSAIRLYNSKQTYVHCEIVFSLAGNTVNCLAYAVFEDKGVVKMKRSFSNPAYRWLYFAISESEHARMIDFCEKQLGKAYDGAAASWRLMVWPPKSRGDRWWCASFVHASFRQIGMLRDYAVNTLDVDDIVSIVEFSTRRIGVAMTPYHIRGAQQKYAKDMFGVDDDDIFGTNSSRTYGKIGSCRNV